jgi:hypothetical protein
LRQENVETGYRAVITGQAFCYSPIVLEKSDMLDRELRAEFESYRKTLDSEEANVHSMSGLSAS